MKGASLPLTLHHFREPATTSDSTTSSSTQAGRAFIATIGRIFFLDFWNLLLCRNMAIRTQVLHNPRYNTIKRFTNCAMGDNMNTAYHYIGFEFAMSCYASHTLNKILSIAFSKLVVEPNGIVNAGTLVLLAHLGQSRVCTGQGRRCFQPGRHCTPLRYCRCGDLHHCTIIRADENIPQRSNPHVLYTGQEKLFYNKRVSRFRSRVERHFAHLMCWKGVFGNFVDKDWVMLDGHQEIVLTTRTATTISSQRL